MLSRRQIWWTLGCIWIQVLLVLSFILTPGLASIPRFDLIAHFIAYLFISTWLLIPCQNRQERLAITASLISMGWATEILQPLTPYHIFDWADGVANTLGTLIAVWLSQKKPLQKLTQYLDPRRR